MRQYSRQWRRRKSFWRIALPSSEGWARIECSPGRHRAQGETPKCRHSDASSAPQKKMECSIIIRHKLCTPEEMECSVIIRRQLCALEKRSLRSSDTKRPWKLVCQPQTGSACCKADPSEVFTLTAKMIKAALGVLWLKHFKSPAGLTDSGRGTVPLVKVSTN